MFTEDESRFLTYWEKNRDREKKLSYQVISGLPWGLLFALPILINFILGRFWYKRADAVASSQFNPLLLVVAVMAIAIFIGVFRKMHRWDMMEQQYKELRAKEMKDAENQSPTLTPGPELPGTETVRHEGQ